MCRNSQMREVTSDPLESELQADDYNYNIYNYI